MNLFDQIPAMPGQPLPLPKAFSRLYDLAYNMWWTWDSGANRMWSQIDPRLWVNNRNPLSILQSVDIDTWEALEASTEFVELYRDTLQRFDEYLSNPATWYGLNHDGDLAGPVAYLCAEFGIHATLPLYSGGLGVLAGDHVKAASDLGLPFVGVGLLYRRGYFRQAVDPEGQQQHNYGRVELVRRAFRRVLDHNRRPLTVPIQFPGRTVYVGAWRLDVGRVPLIFLDTDIPENDPADRPITHILYVRGREMRLCQEIVLGIGGARVLAELDIEPGVWHVNEGHAALSMLERLSQLTLAGETFDDARKAVQDNTAFTLHTPVPAGNEAFDLGLVRRYIDDTLPGISEDMLGDFGRSRQDDGKFDMGALAIRLSSITNGVSRRHGEVVTHDWSQLIGGPSEYVTNGVHTQTWTGRTIWRLFDKYVGEDWTDKLITPEAWETVRDIPNKDLWDAHVGQKELLLRRIRGRIREQLARHGADPDHLRRIDDQLPAERLTIVFARRFATYKRAGLLFSDPGRIRHILTNADRPVQIIFSGKAHPADREGQGLIRWVVEMAKSHELGGHIFFLEDYDMQLGRWLVGGADVWLNNPRPPMEASGTSGMKSAINGGLNLSVLDGWWEEAYDGTNGWGFGDVHQSDPDAAATLYHLLESEVVPLFYDRDEDGVPQGWVEMMKNAIVGVTPQFSTHRMVAEYAEKAYLPLGRR